MFTSEQTHGEVQVRMHMENKVTDVFVLIVVVICDVLVVVQDEPRTVTNKIVRSTSVEINRIYPRHLSLPLSLLPPLALP